MIPKNINYCNRSLCKTSIVLLLLAISFGSLKAQIRPMIACGISGTSPVTQGTTYTYTMSGCTASSWTATCGTVMSFTSTSVTVSFNMLNCSSSTISALNSGGGTVASKTVTVNQPPPLTGGTISNTAQTINYNTIPALILASAATGGSCPDGYTYQWFSSTDGSNYNAIVGEVNQNGQPGSLTATTYFKRQVACGNQVIYTTNVATVSVYPQIAPGTITPSSQAINYNTTPVSLSIPAATGGNGTYSYQWQSSLNTGFTTPTNVGTNSTTYSPPALTSTTYYREVVTSNSATVNSNYATVIVYPQLVGGSISPSGQNINYNTIPSSMSISAPSGGSGTYTYQWYYNNGGGYQIINGATSSSYAPGALTVTTSYEVITSSNGVSVTSSPVTIQFIRSY